MRASLLHPLAETRPARRRRRRRETRRRSARTAQPAAVAVPLESAEQRVREAGGPVDRAFYSCACGMLFQAKVSTTVRCPHCGAGQAW
ncbi:MAG TPA: hypothetical protein VHY83_00110 [Solirubrobacteraceae bacterium]|jgi:hypothetical protein|nr:hypothetical protein [Solirubrobacteraceae bacterium]